MLEHVVLLVSLLAMIYPVVRVILHLIRELRAKKLVVTDRDGNVLAELSTERVQQTDLKDLERLRERVGRDKGTVRAA
jgi:hypothetical protein